MDVSGDTPEAPASDVTWGALRETSAADPMFSSNVAAHVPLNADGAPGTTASSLNVVALQLFALPLLLLQRMLLLQLPIPLLPLLLPPLPHSLLSVVLGL